MHSNLSRVTPPGCLGYTSLEKICILCIKCILFIIRQNSLPNPGAFRLFGHIFWRLMKWQRSVGCHLVHPSYGWGTRFINIAKTHKTLHIDFVNLFGEFSHKIVNPLFSCPSCSTNGRTKYIQRVSIPKGSERLSKGNGSPFGLTITCRENVAN